MSDDDRNRPGESDTPENAPAPDAPETAEPEAAKPETAETEAAETETAEPETAEAEAADSGATDSGAAETRTRRRFPWTKVAVFGVLPTLIVVLVVAAALLIWRQHTLTTTETVAVESVEAAKEATIAMLSYEPETVEEQLVAVRERLTGDFKTSYTQLTDAVVIPGAKERQISAVATVPSAASVSAGPDEAVVLLFVDQTVTVGVGEEMPSSTKSSVRVTLENTDGQWLVSEFEPV
ncbi:hypothetical protein [Mycolicibacterium thermoresistibile]